MLFCLHLESNEYPIVVGGSGTLFFFRPVGVSLERIRGVFGKQKKLQPILCGVEGEPTSSGQVSVFTGTVTGHIYVWQNHKVGNYV